MKRLIVLDTNVVVSAGINSQGSPAKIIQQVLEGELILLTCPSITAEYLEVIARPKFKQFGFPPLWLKTLISLSHSALQNPKPTHHAFSDSGDAVFYHLATSYEAVLITGNLKHFPKDDPAGIRVLSPADYLSLQA
jgi:putative PIN family toxin of toxin-antitoxin system